MQHEWLSPYRCKGLRGYRTPAERQCARRHIPAGYRGPGQLEGWCGAVSGVVAGALSAGADPNAGHPLPPRQGHPASPGLVVPVISCQKAPKLARGVDEDGKEGYR